MQFNDWLSQKGLTDGQFATLVNADRSTISRLRRGKHNASLDLLSRIAEATLGDVTPNDFISLERALEPFESDVGVTSVEGRA